MWSLLLFYCAQRKTYFIIYTNDVYISQIETVFENQARHTLTE